jgi:hypothetical protein
MDHTQVYYLVGAAVLMILLMVFVPVVRRVLGAVIRISVTLAALGAAILGIALLINDVAINESPGVTPRLIRFLTMNQAATSEKGLGSVTCETDYVPVPPGGAPPARPASARTVPSAPVAQSSPVSGPNGSPDDEYPELIQRGYPGISRAKLFQLAQDTVNELSGWKLLKADPHTSTLDCSHTSRFLQSIDDVKIVVTPKSEIFLCSRSRAGEGEPGFVGGLFSGDLGSNIGHIKEFYAAMDPKVEEVYKEQEQKQQAAPR